MTYRSKKHTDLAHEMACTFSFPHKCNGPSVPCHANWQIFGRGSFFKTPDWAWAAGCPAAHYEIDSGKDMDRDTKFMEWLRAFVQTQNVLWENKRLRVT